MSECPTGLITSRCLGTITSIGSEIIECKGRLRNVKILFEGSPLRNGCPLISLCGLYLECKIIGSRCAIFILIRLYLLSEVLDTICKLFA